MNFKQAIEKYVTTDKEYVEKITNPLYGPMDEKKMNAILFNRTKLLSDLVIFALNELQHRDDLDNAKANSVQL